MSATAMPVAVAREQGGPKIGVLGHYGNENLGDEAIVEAVIANVRARFPDARVVGFSINPRDTGRRYGIPAFGIRRGCEEESESRACSGGAGTDRPLATGESAAVSAAAAAKLKAFLKRSTVMRRAIGLAGRCLRLPAELRAELGFLRTSLDRLRGVDLLVVSGSNQFLDNFGGPWGFPYTLLKWSLLAKLASAKLAFVSVGAGPIDARLSRVMVRMALVVADFVSFRDSASLRLIEGPGFRNRGHVYPDLAHSLPVTTMRRLDEHTRPVVGINVMPVYDRRYWFEADDGKYRAYVARIAAFASALLLDGREVFFFATQPKDAGVIHDVIDQMNPAAQARKERAPLVRTSRTVGELMRVIDGADLVVGTRFHGILLSLLAGRPVLGICYHRKSRDLLREMGQERYAVDLETFEADGLLEHFWELEARRFDEARRIESRSAEYRRALQDQYAAVLGLVDRARAVQRADGVGA